MDAGFTCTAKLFHGTLALRYNDMMLGGKSRHQCMFTCKLLSTGLTHQTPARSRFACKYAVLGVCFCSFYAFSM